MAETKLYRNLKAGDKFVVHDNTDPKKHRTAVVTVSGVREIARGFISHKRQWEVSGDYPWWFVHAIIAYSTDKVEVL